MNYIFILSHQDDEIPLFKYIKDLSHSGKKVYIFYLTNGNIYKKINLSYIKKREKESLKVLKKLNVNVRKIFFLGRKFRINSYKLHENINDIYYYLFKFLKKINGKITIYCHAWEGGNVDHDTSFIIVSKLIKTLEKKIECTYQFPFYNSYKSILNFYRVFYSIKKNDLSKKRISLLEKIQFIKYLFFYRSQIKIWFGLYPFIIYYIISNNFGIVQKLNKKFKLKKPHSGLLWYEKRKINNFNRLSKNYLDFLNN